MIQLTLPHPVPEEQSPLANLNQTGRDEIARAAAALLLAIVRDDVTEGEIDEE